MSTNYNAGLDSSDVVLSYGEEAVYGTKPAVAFKALRMTGEGFREQKSRARPEEIEPKGFAAHAITQSAAAEGSISLAFSAGTYDDMLAGLVNGDWGTTIAIDQITTDITVSTSLSGGGKGFSTTLSNKFNAIQPGQYVRVSGCTNAANNGIFRVIARTATTLRVADSYPLVNETPASGAVKIRGQMLRNGTSVHTYWFQKQLASNMFLNYPGSYVSEGSLSANQGSFMEGSLSFLVKSEEKATSNGSTGSVVAASTGRVIDTVNGVREIVVNDVALDAVTQGIEISVTKNNARLQYGIGSAAAKGMARGTLELSGTFSTYFKSFAEYDLYKSETDQLVSFAALDDTGAGYVITLPAATLMNPQITASGPDSDVMAEFELEGNAAATGIYAGVVIQIDKIPAPGA